MTQLNAMARLIRARDGESCEARTTAEELAAELLGIARSAATIAAGNVARAAWVDREDGQFDADFGK